jgi:uncharacterized protein (PEP-CTERM system associated)
VAAAALLFSSAGHAAEWTITPAIDVNETYTDNVNLQPGSRAKSDFVTQVTPSVTVVGKGPRLTLNATYGAQETYYGNQNAASSLSNLLRADAKARVIDNLLYFDSSASITQQNISAFGPQAVDNTNSSGNRTNVRSMRFSPYLSHRFSSFATTELRYARDAVSASSGGLSTSNTDTVSFNAKSGSAFQTLGWGLQGSDATTHYTGQNDVRLQNIVGTLSYLLTPRFRLIGTTGYDHNDYTALGGTSAGYSWSGGFDWRYSSRTSLSASVGHKYYGNTFSLSALTRSRVANWSLSYDETVTTTPALFAAPGSVDTSTYLNQLLSGTITDAALRAQTVNQLIQSGNLPSSLSNSVNYFTNTTFLQKQLQAAVLLSSPKTTLLLSVFDIRREPLSSQTGIVTGQANDTTEQVGGSAVLTRRLSALTRANVTLLATRVKSVSTGRVDNTQSLRLGVTQQLGRKVRGTIELRRNQGQSTQADVAYRENAISAFLNFQL